MWHKSINLSKRKTDFLYFVLFLSSMALVLWGIDIYRVTIIEPKYLICSMFLGAFIETFVVIYFIKSIYSKFWTYTINILAGAGFFYFGLLYTNKIFADQEVISEKFEIIKTGTLAKSKYGNCVQPFVIINFSGIRKQLVFACEYKSVIKNYSKVELFYSKGFYGFNVIERKELW